MERVRFVLCYDNLGTRGSVVFNERKKAERFHVRVDRESHIVGRALARIAIGRLLDRSPESLRFSYNNFGKPCLADDAK